MPQIAAAGWLLASPRMRFFLLPMLFSFAALAPAATVSTLDGQTIQGPGITFDPKAGTVTAGSTSVALADCDWVEPHTGVGVVVTGTPAKRMGVWLADGSWLPVSKITVAKSDDAIAVDGPLGPLVLPLTALRGWGDGVDLLPAPEGAAERDVALLASGAVPGRVEGIKAGQLILRSDLDPAKPLELPLADVRALRLAVPARAAKGVRLAVSLDDLHPPLRVVPTATGLALAVAPTVALGDALRLARLRVEGGRRVHLGELKPAVVEEVGAFGVVWPFQVDRNLDGSPLRLGGIRYERGVVVHSQARLAWKLGGAYVRLRAQVGIADLVGEQGDCTATVRLDGKPAWSKDSLKGGDKPISLDLDLTGVQQLELSVEYGARYDIGDHLALADAYLVKAK